MVSFTIEGVVAPVFTPVNRDSTVNYDVIPAYLQFLADEGIKAVLVGGTSGEAMCLSVAERRKLSESWVMAAKQHDMQVVVQVGGAPLPDVLELAKHAEYIKAAAILTLPELYFKPRSTEQLVFYLQTVAKAAPTLPLLYYHFPMMSGVNVDLKKFFKLASATIPSFRGMKADLDVMLQVSDQLTGDRRIFNGNHLVAPAAFFGQESSIATVTNLFPRLVKDIISSMKSGDVVKARALQEKMNGLVGAIAGQGDWVPTMKVAMELVTGLKVGPPRLPLEDLDDEQKRTIRDNLVAKGVQLRG